MSLGPVAVATVTPSRKQTSLSSIIALSQAAGSSVVGSSVVGSSVVGASVVGSSVVGSPVVVVVVVVVVSPVVGSPVVVDSSVSEALTPIVVSPSSVSFVVDVGSVVEDGLPVVDGLSVVEAVVLPAVVLGVFVVGPVCSPVVKPPSGRFSPLSSPQAIEQANSARSGTRMLFSMIKVSKGVHVTTAPAG